jgi:hypothetical protein
MSIPAKYPRVPVYPHERIVEVSAAVTRLRDKVVIRRTHELALGHVQTVLHNRDINLTRPECKEKMGVVIYGDSGAGKSHFLRKRVHTLPELLAQPEVGTQAFARVKFKAPMKLQSAGFLTASALGYLAERNNEKHDYWGDVSLRVEALGTRAIQFDETQDAFIRANRLSAENFLQTFKGLMTHEPHPVALIVTGTRALEPYFKIADQQGPRRFYHVTLPNLHFDVDAAFVKNRIDEYCTLAHLENGLEEQDYHRLMHSVSYAFGRTFSRALDGIEEALLANSSRLERVHLVHAYERESTDNHPGANVFAVEDYLRVDPTTRDFALPSVPEKRKSQPRSETKW